MGSALDEFLEGQKKSGEEAAAAAGEDAAAAAAAAAAAGGGGGAGGDAAAAAAGEDAAAAAAAAAGGDGGAGGDAAAAAAAAAAEGSKEINIDSINRVFGSQYSSIDDIKNVLGQVDEIDSLRAREQQHIELIEREYDPMSVFADEKSFKFNEVRKQNPDVSPFVINQLLDIDNLDNMDGMQALVLKRVMDTPSYQRNINEIENLINFDYGLDIDIDKIEDEGDKSRAEQKIRLGKLRMEGDAEKAKKEFTSLLNVEIPKKKNVDDLVAERQSKQSGAIEKLKKDFTPIAEGLLKSLDKVELKYPDGSIAIDFDVSVKDKDYLHQGILDAAIRSNLNPGNIDDVKTLNNYARNFIVANNLSKILKAHEENIVAKMKNNEYDVHHVANPGDLNKGMNAAGQHGTETNDDIVLREAKKKE